MRKREAENVAAGGDRDVLDAIDHVGHGRSMHGLSSIEVPEWTAGAGFNRFQRTGIVPEKYQPAGGGQRSSPGIAGADLGITPHCFSIGHGERHQ